ncbi:hypothetical protein P0F65_10110 [Sphingomonas sp. I4]
MRTSNGPYQVAAYARGDIRRYARYTSENTEEGWPDCRAASRWGRSAR